MVDSDKEKRENNGGKFSTIIYANNPTMMKMGENCKKTPISTIR